MKVHDKYVRVKIPLRSIRNETFVCFCIDEAHLLISNGHKNKAKPGISIQIATAQG